MPSIVIPEKVKRAAKAVVTVAGFVVLVGAQVADGHIDANAIVTAGVGVLTALGVYRVRNAA